MVIQSHAIQQNMPPISVKCRIFGSQRCWILNSLFLWDGKSGWLHSYPIISFWAFDFFPIFFHSQNSCPDSGGFAHVLSLAYPKIPLGSGQGFLKLLSSCIDFFQLDWNVALASGSREFSLAISLSHQCQEVEGGQVHHIAQHHSLEVLKSAKSPGDDKWLCITIEVTSRIKAMVRTEHSCPMQK